MIDARQAVWICTLALTFSAGWLDWHSRRIPNWLTVPGLFLGVALNSALSGWNGTKASVEGAGLALVLLLPPVLMRALGAGDWKLMGAVGAFLGAIPFLYVLVGSIFVSGLMAIAQMVQTRRVKTTLHNLLVLVQGFFAFGLRAHPEISLDNPGLLKLPFGVAVAAAALVCYVAARWGL